MSDLDDQREPASELQYRTIEPEERQLMRAAGERAQAAGCAATLAGLLGLPVLCGFLVAAWTVRNDLWSAFCLLLYAAGLGVLLVIVYRRARQDFRPRAFAGGMALGLAALAAMLAIATIVAVLLIALLDLD